MGFNVVNAKDPCVVSVVSWYVLVKRKSTFAFGDVWKEVVVTFTNI